MKGICLLTTLYYNSAYFFFKSRGGSVEAIKGLERLISIWTERNVYEATFLVKLHKCLGESTYTNYHLFACCALQGY